MLYPHPPPIRGCTQAAFHQVCTRAQNAIYSGDKQIIKLNSVPWLTLSRCLLIEIRTKHDPTTRLGEIRAEEACWTISHQAPILHPHGMQRTANTLGLKVTAESENYVKKSCVADRYRRMAGQVEISCTKGAENGGIVERVFGKKHSWKGR